MAIAVLTSIAIRPLRIFSAATITLPRANVDYTREASKRLLHLSIPLQFLASKRRASGDETATLWRTGGRDYSNGSQMEPPGCLEGIGCRVYGDRFTSRIPRKSARRANRGAAGGNTNYSDQPPHVPFEYPGSRQKWRCSGHTFRRFPGPKILGCPAGSSPRPVRTHHRRGQRETSSFYPSVQNHRNEHRWQDRPEICLGPEHRSFLFSHRQFATFGVRGGRRPV